MEQFDTSSEPQEGSAEEHPGEAYLRLLDLGHLADQDIKTRDGRVIQGRDFLEVCGEHAEPALEGLRDTDPDDPTYNIAKNALRKRISRYVTGEGT